MNHLDMATNQPTDTSSGLCDLKSFVDTFRSDAMDKDIQKIIHQEIEVKNLPLMKELESFRNHSHDLRLRTTFDTDREQEQGEFIMNNVDAWIDTAQDSSTIVSNASCIGMKMQFFCLY